MGVILTTYESRDDFASKFPPKMENFPIFHGKFGRESRLTPCPEGELALGDVETLVVSCNKDGEKRLTPGDFPEDIHGNLTECTHQGLLTSGYDVFTKELQDFFLGLLSKSQRHEACIENKVFDLHTVSSIVSTL